MKFNQNMIVFTQENNNKKPIGYLYMQNVTVTCMHLFTTFDKDRGSVFHLFNFHEHSSVVIVFKWLWSS